MAELDQQDILPVKATHPRKRLRRYTDLTIYGFDLIPNEILTHVLTYLDWLSLIRLQMVYKRCLDITLPSSISNMHTAQIELWREGVQLLHKYGSNCLLSYSIQYAKRDLLDYAITQGANVNRTCMSVSPLEEAVVRNEYELFEILIQYGATPDLKTLDAIAFHEEKEETDYRYSLCLGRHDTDLLNLIRNASGRINLSFYHQYRLKKIVPIDKLGANGANHRDWDDRKYHKKCWRLMKSEATRERTHVRDSYKRKALDFIDLTNE